MRYALKRVYHFILGEMCVMHTRVYNQRAALEIRVRIMCRYGSFISLLAVSLESDMLEINWPYRDRKAYTVESI